MELEDVMGNAADQDRGRMLELVSPWDGQPTGIKLWIVGPDSATARRARFALTDALADAADADGRISAEAREKARLDCLAALVQRWEVTEGDKPVPFSTKAVLTLLRVHWVEQQVDAFAGDRRNFSPEA